MAYESISLEHDYGMVRLGNKRRLATIVKASENQGG